MKPRTRQITAVDLFCGAGGLTRGLLDAGLNVTAGYDIDKACRYPFEHNNSPAVFHCKSVSDLKAKELSKHYSKHDVKILVGCAPCVTFSKYTQGVDHKKDPKWSLLREFGRLVRETKPHIVSMENVPELQRHSVFDEFLQILDDEKFCFATDVGLHVVYCPDYGIPQHRTRLVVLASRFGPIALLPPTHRPEDYRTVSDTLRSLSNLGPGDTCATDPLHCTSGLSPLNLRRLRHSTPGGTWRDWPRKLRAKCHRRKNGKTYPSVYGRMEWGEPSPTITTQFYGFGNGRFGHPEQDRALSLREGALLQSFPKSYAFVKPGGICHFKTVGRMIGNAVPVRLGKIIGRSIRHHVVQHGDQ
ncbi:MAG TPA: DNA cytosine methyltransferase [Pirellulaceae bacterium]|nr:DNA cytosine methyltransferase [Pirellulaceae bacterium]